MKAPLFLTCFLLSLVGIVKSEKTQGVVVSIKPLHSMVSAIIGDTGEATLLLDNNTSPHDFQLKPSQLRTMYNSKVIFYIDDKFETFLTSVFESLPKRVGKYSVAQIKGLKIYEQREGGAWEGHGHHHEEEHHHDKHHEEEHHHEKEGHHEEKHHHEEEDHHDEKHENYDMHIWLDPTNAIKLVNFYTKELSKIFPSNKEVYLKNSKAYIEKITKLDLELKSSLAGLQDKSYIVFHDAYQYFEKAYHLKAVGSITLDPNESPSPKRLLEIRRKIDKSEVLCIFREPQFSDRLVKIVVEGSKAKSGTIDPLGATIEPGEGLYLQLLKNMGLSIKSGLE